MPNRSSSIDSSPALSSEAPESTESKNRTYLIVWFLVAAALVGVVTIGPQIPRIQSTVRLAFQAAQFATGKSPEVSSLGGLENLVPVPQNFRLLGVTPTPGSMDSGVVGLMGAGDVSAVAAQYLEALDAKGWKVERIDEGLGMVILSRDSPLKAAAVSFRQTTSSGVTVVVQID